MNKTSIGGAEPRAPVSPALHRYAHPIERAPSGETAAALEELLAVLRQQTALLSSIDRVQGEILRRLQRPAERAHP